MHRIALVAPFLCSSRPDLSRVLSTGPYVVRDQLAADFGAWRCTRPDEGAHAALIDEHESLGASLLPDRLLVASRDVPAAAQDAGVAEVTASVGLHGVGAVVFWLQPGVPPDLSEVERSLCALVHDLAVELGGRLTSCGAFSTTEATGRYPQDEFLYWHRVLVGPDARELWRQRLSGDVAVDGAGSAVVRLGDGYTTVSGGTEREVRDVLRGLVRAQELWLTGTTVSQQLLLEIGRLTAQEARSGTDLASAQRSTVALADREALRTGVVRDEITFTTGLQRAVLQAAARSWEMELEGTPVRERLDVLLQMLERRVAEQQARQQARLNGIVLALTVLGALSLVLGLFETAVGDGLGQPDAARLLVSAIVGLLAATTALLALRRSGRTPGG